jgi:iron complex outermembrane recepter protein
MLAMWGAALVSSTAEAATPAAPALADLSLEDLSRIEITSVSKRAEPLADAAASVFIITGDDIRRSGATSLPEALRLAPNLQVARVSATEWAISARGFNSQSANKLLVLIDGRSVYSPLFSGVFWDVQDLMLEDVDRIEVISGPGGTLWGVNAVNGVVNVTTKSSAVTQGSLVSAGTGNQESRLAFRHGAPIGDSGSWRVYGKRSHLANTETANGTQVNDHYDLTQLGMRADWKAGDDKYTLQGDAYQGKKGQPPPGTIVTGAPFELGDISVSGANMVGRWERRLSEGSNVSGQLTYDRVERTVRPTFAEKLDIFDVQLQHAWTPVARHSVVWGTEYRYAIDHVDNSAYVAFLPGTVKQQWMSLFAQDEIALDAAWRLALGARLEKNDYTGFEFLPNLRLSWKPADAHLVWGAASRTVRAPSRLDRDTYVPGEPPFLLAGGPDFRSETANVYELGYRGQPAANVSFAVTAYHAEYDDLHTQNLVSSAPLVLQFGNGMEGRVQGVEMWGSLQATSSWRLHAGFSRLWQDFQLKPGTVDTANSVAVTTGANPDRQILLRSSWNLLRVSQLDVTVRHVSDLDNPSVPSYTALDMRWGWTVRPGVEVSITGQNLLGPKHGEFAQESTRSAFSRTVFAELVSSF